MRYEIAQIMTQNRVMELVYGNNATPKDILGRHMVAGGQVIAAYNPDAVKMTLIDEDGRSYPMDPVERQAIFAIFIPETRLFAYKIEMTFRDGNTYLSEDPYSFPCQITEEEQKMFHKGKWKTAYQKLGAHPMTIDGVSGVYFATWAPNARRVSVVGDFNFWNGMIYPMNRISKSGIFEIFIPGVKVKSRYRYEIKTADGPVIQKADPYGSIDENGQNDTSIVIDVKEFIWKDQEWLKERRQKTWKSTPFAVCDREFLDNFAEEFKEGECFTHVLLKAPVYCHGVAGDIRKWIDDMHQSGIGVIMEVSLGLFGMGKTELTLYDGTPIYGHHSSNSFYKDEEKQMYRFNHDRKEVVNYLLSYLIFWMREYHVDGYLFEGVTDMIHPICVGEFDASGNPKTAYLEKTEKFICKAVKTVKEEDFSVLVFSDEKAELELHNDDLMYSKAHFDALLNYSIVQNFGEYLMTAIHDPAKDYYKVGLPLMKNQIRKTIINVSIRDSVAFQKEFLESAFLNEYDHLSWKKLTMGYLMGVPGKKRWAWQQMESAPVQNYMKKIFHLYMEHRCMYHRERRKSSFQWVNGLDAKNTVLSFLRRTEGEDKNLLFVFNFSREKKEGFYVGAPVYGEYRLLLNSDWEEFGGSVRNYGDNVMHALKKERDLQPYSLRLTIPGLSMLVFEY